MNRNPERLPPDAALRPWPYGPPLRGRAPRSVGGQRVALRQAPSTWQALRLSNRLHRQDTGVPVPGVRFHLASCSRS